MEHVSPNPQSRIAVVAALRAFGAADSTVGRRFAQQQGMHATDAAAIVEILDAEARGELLTPARLAARIALTAGATSTLVNRLEEAGHVVRRRDASDRRVVTLHSTPQIHADAEEFFAPIASALDSALAALTVGQLRRFATVLEDMTDVIATELASHEE